MGDGSEGDVGGGRGPQHDTSMVWLICPMASVLSEWVQARGRVPSTELALVREAVRERARRVMLADGTARAQREPGCSDPSENLRDLSQHCHQPCSPMRLSLGTSLQQAVL